MLLAVVLAPAWAEGYLQGGRQAATSKSFRRTSQYIPHSSGRLGTNRKHLQTHSRHAVLAFFPKYAALCPASPCPQKHFE